MHETAFGIAVDRDAGARVSPPRPFDAGARALHAQTLPPEFAALERAGVAPGPLYAAVALADRQGVEPFDALLAEGCVDETELVEALAFVLGVDAIRTADRRAGPICADTFALASDTGHLAGMDEAGEPRFVVAARGAAIRRLAAARRGQPRTRAIALAAPRDYAELLTARAGSALARRAADGPGEIAPELTAAAGLPRVPLPARGLIIFAAAAAIGACFVFDAAATAALVLAGLLFAVMNGFRLWLAGARLDDDAPAARVAEADLPVYTVLVALYREAAVIPALIDALERLDYPAAKLDIKILTEADDDETRAAIALRRPRGGIETLTVPPGGPRTKPRALNAGLLCARGRYLAVFDAEDRPEPGQLRLAVDAFRRSGPDLACAQARLAIDNAADGWLCRHFAIEYAALFDVMLPALSALRLPIPLGGTSNHFRVAALKRVGGWDAGNVTEDAELGLRLARFGYRTETIASVTWEEAPTRLTPWIRQRTRWMKGFMVTTAIHGLRPAGLLRAVGPIGFVSAQLTVAGVALTALAFPLMTALMLWQAATGALMAQAGTLGEALLFGFHVANMITGFAAGVAYGWIGVERRGAHGLARTLATLPVYWLLVGCAAWRALWQIARAQTSDWEKTVHGVSTRRAPPAVDGRIQV